MTITNYRSSSSDVIFFKKGEPFEVKASDPEYCIFGIDFDKVISYKVKKTVWKDESSAISVFITLEKGEEYILMRKTSNSEKILNKIINPDKKEGFYNEFSKEYQEMMPKYGEIDQIVDLKYIFDLLIND